MNLREAYVLLLCAGIALVSSSSIQTNERRKRQVPGPAGFGGPGLGGPGFGGPGLGGPRPGFGYAGAIGPGPGIVGGAAPIAAQPVLPVPRPALPIPAVPAVPVAPVPAAVVTQTRTIGVGVCPGGDSLGVPCDAKRPWPQCPPQSYCYASNTVDIGPYYCCPIWSTYGAQWRPRAPFYPYYPPMPYNWPAVIKATAGWPSAVVPGAVYTGYAAPWSKVKGLLDRTRHLKEESTLEENDTEAQIEEESN